MLSWYGHKSEPRHRDVTLYRKITFDGLFIRVYVVMVVSRICEEIVEKAPREEKKTEPRKRNCNVETTWELFIHISKKKMDKQLRYFATNGSAALFLNNHDSTLGDPTSINK